MLNTYKQDDKAAELIAKLSLDANAHAKFRLKQGLLYYGNRLYVGARGKLTLELISQHHGSAMRDI